MARLLRKISRASAVLMLVFVSAASAATITVEQGGSGDYTQIQPALDSCASGDTLLIGPGVYQDFNPSYIPGYAWDVDVFAYVHVAELTIIGAGSDETVIGPSSYQGDSQTYSPKGLVWLAGTELRVSGLTLRNSYEGIHAINAPIIVDNCRFENNSIGVIWKTAGSGGGVFNSVFESEVGGADGIYFVGNGYDVEVDSCLFDGCGVLVQNFHSVQIRNCEIRNTVVGLQVDNGTQCFVEDSRIFNCANVGITLYSPSYGNLSNCEVSGGGAAVSVNSFCTLLATNTSFFGGYWASINLNSGEASEVSNCHIISGTGPAIRSYRYPGYSPVVHDLRNNYWGTSDIEEIRAMILDGTDDPNNLSTVLFEPIAGQPVSTENMTLDGVKALYR